jgi:hypothetical protein
MNKKILYAAIISIVLQLFYAIAVYAHLFTPSIRMNLLLFQFIFHLIAIPFVCYTLLTAKQQVKHMGKLLNITGVLFTFPVFFLFILIDSSFREYPTEDINPEDITIYDTSGNQIPLDSVPATLEKDSASISRIIIKPQE